MPRTTPRRRDRIQANHGVRRSRSNTTPSSSSSTQPSHQHAPLSNDHLYGVIMWLPREHDLLLISHARYGKTTRALCGLESGPYNHPVLVLSPVHKSSFTTTTSTATDLDDHQHEAAMVKILIITSFDETDILDKFPLPSQAERRRTYLPISPADRHPDLTDIPVLRLAGGLEMGKKSYVNIIKTHDVPIQALRPYRKNGSRRGGDDDEFSGVRYLLTRESYLIVAQQAGYSIPTISVPVAIPVALPSPPPSPSTPRRTRRQFSPPPTTVEQRLGLTNSARGMFTNTSATTAQPPSTIFENFQVERVRPDALNPGRGTRVAAARTEVTPLLPVHVYQNGGRAGRRSGIPSRRPRDGYYPAGGAPSHPQTRDGLIVVCIGLALLAGAGCGIWAAWVYRAAIGRGLLVSGRWIVENGREVVKAVLKFGWRVLLSIVKWVGGVVKGAAGWVWDKLKGVLG